MKQNVLLDKSFAFAIDMVKLSRIIQNEKKEYILSRQLVKSATSIGANAEEAMAGQSSADFISKMTIAHKEARETRYWLKLLTASDIHDCTAHFKSTDEIIKIISSILLTAKERNEKK